MATNPTSDPSAKFDNLGPDDFTMHALQIASDQRCADVQSGALVGDDMFPTHRFPQSGSDGDGGDVGT